VSVEIVEAAVDDHVVVEHAGYMVSSWQRLDELLDVLVMIVDGVDVSVLSLFDFKETPFVAFEIEHADITKTLPEGIHFNL